jgi:transmembrane sensor
MKEGYHFDNNIIVRFLMNEASHEDILLLEDWISSDAEHFSYFEQIRDTWNSIELEKELDKHNIQNDFEKVLNRIEEKDTIKDNLKFKRKNLNGNWIFKIAAVFILGFVVSWLVFTKSTSIIPHKTAFNVIETPKGSSTTINLPDGSKVWLNAGSKLRYPQDFSISSRNVFLEGEAFFEIAKDKKRQFLVKTADLTVKVFGTRFNVKSYPGDHTVETTLVEGSISIQKNLTSGLPNGKEINMEPNQRIVLYKDTEKVTPTISQTKRVKNVPARKAKFVLSKRIQTDRFTSWKDGQLIFKSEPMLKLAVTLERRYNVKIYFESEEIKQFRFTGTIEDETIEQVMAALKIAASIDYRIEEREIWISKKE